MANIRPSPLDISPRHIGLFKPTRGVTKIRWWWCTFTRVCMLLYRGIGVTSLCDSAPPFSYNRARGVGGFQATSKQPSYTPLILQT